MTSEPKPEPEPTARSSRIISAEIPIEPSPSGLPTQHLVSSRNGSSSLFVAQQWLQPGQHVLLHTHPVEEAIVVLTGEGEATLDGLIVPIVPGHTLYVPAGAVHAFRCLQGTLHVIFTFPTPDFAPTNIVGDGAW